MPVRRSASEKTKPQRGLGTGQIPSIRIGKRIVVPKAAFEKLLEGKAKVEAAWMAPGPERAAPGVSGNGSQGNRVGNEPLLNNEPQAPAQEPNGFGFCVASDIKRFRRTKAEITRIRQHIEDILQQDNPQTVRQVFYALTVRGVIAKAEIEYQRTVIRLLVEMREDGTIPDWIADNTRWMRKPISFIALNASLKAWQANYRRDLWAAMPVYVEIWCKKDALAGVIVEETSAYDVPLMVARGYSSISFLHSAAETITAKEKPAFIYHVGDLDPSGVDAARDIEAKLRRYAPEAEIHFEKIAVTREQAETWNLPTRPTKQTDTRAKKFSGESVELDAIPAHQLRELIREAIERHVDQRQLRIIRAAEELERETLGRWAEIIGGTP